MCYFQLTTLLKVTLLKVKVFHGCFSRFLNRANGTKSRQAFHIEAYNLINVDILPLKKVHGQQSESSALIVDTKEASSRYGSTNNFMKAMKVP